MHVLASHIPSASIYFEQSIVELGAFARPKYIQGTLWDPPLWRLIPTSSQPEPSLSIGRREMKPSPDPFDVMAHVHEFED